MMKKIGIVLLFSSCMQASTITWIAQSPNNDMNNASNWEPATIPGSGDLAVFDSSITGISTNPTESSAQFSVSALNFPNQASPFLFTFNNQSLAFSGAGITGAQTNPTLSLINTNNSTFLGDMISFTSVGTTGSARITAANSGTLTGASSHQSISSIGSHLHAEGAFTVSNGGTITAQNNGTDSATGSGGNSIAIGAASQIECDGSFTSGNNVEC